MIDSVMIADYVVTVLQDLYAATVIIVVTVRVSVEIVRTAVNLVQQYVSIVIYVKAVWERLYAMVVVNAKVVEAAPCVKAANCAATAPICVKNVE